MYVARDAGVLYRVMQRVIWGLFRLFTRLHASGFDNVPLTGPVIISPNHLHMLDIPLVYMCTRRRVAVLVADKWRRLVGGWLIRLMTDVIFVARGEADREAVTASLKSPEGRRCARRCTRRHPHPEARASRRS